MKFQRWPGEVCKRCGRRNTVGFVVNDVLWSKVVGDPDTIRCLICFDEEAQKRGVRYTGSDIIEMYPVSWSDWDEFRPQGAMCDFCGERPVNPYEHKCSIKI